ncbi:MAG TPA: toxin-antitoxin system YwqK family antitoxin [Pirellulales bacterium]|nr:toxin-antitoxin system YwqK family antitoxin [Pirellulales bacterium]
MGVCAGALFLLALAGCGSDQGKSTGDKATTDKAADASQGNNITGAPAASQTTPTADKGAVKPVFEEKSAPPPTFVGQITVEELYPNKKLQIRRMVKRYSDDSMVNHGPYTSFYLSGEKLEEGNYVDGKKDGAWHMWYPNGQEAKVENYIDGQLDGHWTLFTDKGVQQSEVSYKAGQRDGRWIVYGEDGKQIREQTDYRDGKPDGTSIAWNADGKKTSEMHFERGQLNGTQTQWFPNGQMSKQVEFKDGKLNGKLIQWNDKGEKLLEQDYADGQVQKQQPAKGG